MLRSNSEESKEAGAVLRGESPQQGDVKLYSQFPDYDDFRGYDLGTDEQLEETAKRIFVNFHKPSWRALKHHLSVSKMPQKLLRKIKVLAENGKKG